MSRKYISIVTALVVNVVVLTMLLALPTLAQGPTPTYITILHTNDTHGTWDASVYNRQKQGMVYLASLIKAERAKNPNTLLLDGGDSFQGNAFAQYYRNAITNPIAGGMNLLNYDAMMLGNHEFNFGKDTFATMLGQLNFPILGKANMADDGRYGFINDHVKKYITKTVGGVKIAIFGVTNPWVPSYELPSNIVGLSFTPGITTVKELLAEIKATEKPNLIIALNHIGYQPYKGETDSDEYIAQNVPGIDVIIGSHSHTVISPTLIVTSTLNPTGTLIAQTGSNASYLGRVVLKLTGNITNGYKIDLREGVLIPAGSTTPDADLVSYLTPFLGGLKTYTDQQIGQTTGPIDSASANSDGFTQETSNANLQADAAVFKLAKEGVNVDFHLSGVMSNKKVAVSATITSPLTLTINDMYTLMPYENSLLALKMNGPQLKAVLERAYRNYFYYKYKANDTPQWGGYSHYTTCMIDINAGGQITYKDTAPALPDGNNVVSLVVNGQSIDFVNATKFYTISTVNYLAAGSCNFSDNGKSLWPLENLVADTQYYVRDSVIDYIKAKGTITPTIEQRLKFQTAPKGKFVTILHTNDFHGNLEASGSNPGIARVAQVVKDVRADVGAENVLLLDAGDEMQGTMLSNLKWGEPVIDLFNLLGYNAATMGNHEFDWGQTKLISRTKQAIFPYVVANLVVKEGTSCDGVGWTTPSWVKPWITKTVGSGMVVGIVGVTSQETPGITIASATDGLCFKDAAESIAHYYDQVKAAGANTVIVLSHLGYPDGGYGYGMIVYGDQTLAKKLVEAGKPVDLIIGGHSHTNLLAPTVVSGTTVVQAYNAGRKVGRADLMVDPTSGKVTVNWKPITVTVTAAEDADVKAKVAQWIDPTFIAQRDTVVGFSNVDLVRNYNGDNTMGRFINDAIYNDLNKDSEPLNDADMVFNNAGGLRVDLTSATKPFTLTHGMLFSVLPFGNQTIVGEMSGARIMEVLTQSATLFKGAIQVSGIRFGFAKPATVFNVKILNRVTGKYEPLVITKTYRVATNEFLAPAGGDNFAGFKGMTNITYWGDMLDVVERWVAKSYPATSPYNETLDGRVATQEGNIGPDDGGRVVSNDGRVEVEFPKQFVTNTTRITHTNLMTPTQPITKWVRPFTLIARDDKGIEVKKFKKLFTITIVFSDEELSTQGLISTSLTVKFWNGSKWEAVVSSVDCLLCGVYVDKANHTILVLVDHMTEFVVAEADATTKSLYLPIVIKK